MTIQPVSFRWNFRSVLPVFGFAILLSVANITPAPASPDKPIIVGLDADISSGAAQSGEAIRRGILLAMDEINATGGVLGRQLELTIRDHRGNPARGIDNIEAFAQMEDLVAVVGGIHTPVAIAELETIHRHEIIYLGPWAAGTPVVENGFDPNFVFRVSVRDEFAGGFLIEKALERGFKRPGLLLWRTNWGRSNEKAMTAALDRLATQPAGIEWFNSGQKDISHQIQTLLEKGADVIMLVANPGDGLTVVRNMAARPTDARLPIISHWGITGGEFYNAAPEEISSIDLTFLQTFNFSDPPFPKRADKLYNAYCAKFGDCTQPENVKSPVGTAHAYDLIHLLKMALEKAGSTDVKKLHAALESLDRHEGLMRNYDPPFTPKRHDALDATSFQLSRYAENGAILPVEPK